ncbi:MAG: hypothetical protein ACYS30_19670 [Planctomycetota bacterium]|jgi:hypothetical protein
MKETHPALAAATIGYHPAIERQSRRRTVRKLGAWWVIATRQSGGHFACVLSSTAFLRAGPHTERHEKERYTYIIPIAQGNVK